MLIGIITAVVVLAALSLLASFGLAMAARKFAVPVDPKIAAIEEALPHANCGGCGLPGCAELARRIADGHADVDACPVGGTAVANAIAEIMGKAFESSGGRKIALVLCAGDDTLTARRFYYNGINDCASAALVFGGDKACQYGCMGLGTCAGVCPFDAIHMMPNGIPHVSAEKCTACGKCVKACPKHIIKLVPEERNVHILCSSHDKGARVRRYCKVGCIACTKCVKEAPAGAITMEDNLAVVNYAMEIPPEVASSCPMSTIVIGGTGILAPIADEPKIAAGGER